VRRRRLCTVIEHGARLPRNVDGLFLAGRCNTAMGLGHYGGKRTGKMISIGELAGIAAALCAQVHELPHDIGVRQVQDQLDEMGASLQWRHTYDGRSPAEADRRWGTS